MKRKNSGITLIALIITIIIMLILAGATISILSGSDGLLAKAEKAVSETEKATMQEDAELAIATIKMDYYEDYATNKNMTAKEFIVAKLAEPYETAMGATMEADEDGNITYTLDGVSTKLTIDENGKVTFGESSSGGDGSGGSGEGGSGGTTPTIPEGLEVGDTVTYSPSGTYNWAAEYASSDLADDGSADVALASGTSVTSSNQDMTISTWKVYSINETTGEVELVPSSETTGTVRLQGAQGYNNAVYLLNDACNNLYGDSSKGITARSINMDDIEEALTDEAVATLQDESYWEVQTESAYTTNKSYPTIYAQENLSVIDGTKNESGLGMSEQTALIGRTDEGATLGKLIASTSIQPYSTEYPFWILFDEFSMRLFVDFA